ncbi:hypothetical protein CVT25_007393 [Psilocybe cyanescens]|uniref:Uncharacterized protein n=1 Tax=Psilocybe cyanescens TaxID=93625 RepID=A0A409XJD6_PSICY|nr:hypothetical protein CVT25_007393 [Psilocybe cyanescens]
MAYPWEHQRLCRISKSGIQLITAKIGKVAQWIANGVCLCNLSQAQLTSKISHGAEVVNYHDTIPELSLTLPLTYQGLLYTIALWSRYRPGIDLSRQAVTETIAEDQFFVFDELLYLVQLWARNLNVFA